MKTIALSPARMTATAAVFAVLALCSRPGFAAPAAIPLGSWSEGLLAPTDLTADAVGNLFVVESGAGQIVAVDAFGRPSVVKKDLAGPLAIASDAGGNFYVSQQNGSVTLFDPRWNAQGQLGAGPGEFSMPNAIAVDVADSAATVYVCDGHANEVKAYRNSALWLRFGNRGAGNGQFNFPAGIWVSGAGEVFVVDQGNNRVEVFNRSGQFLRAFPLGESIPFAGPSGRSLGITGDHQNRLYVADVFQGFIRVFDTNGTALDTLGDFGGGLGRFRTPARMVVDSLNRLCVASVNNGRVELLGIGDYLHVTVKPARRLFAAGTDITLSAVIGGAGTFTYQWRKNGVNIAGATSATLNLTGVTLADSAIYSVVATGKDGLLTSPDAAVTVLGVPQILAMSASQSVFQGAQVLLNVSAAGDMLSYQWQRNGTELPGATNATWLLASAQPEDSGHYTVSVGNAVGTATSDPAVLTVRPPPLSPQIDSISLAPGNGVALQVYGDPGYVYAIEGSTNLLDWSGLIQLTNETGTLDFLLPNDPNQPMLFYRAKWAP